MESLNSEQKNNHANYGKRLPFRRVVRYARSMTRYLCAPDSFKESLTAMEAARAMAQGIENADHDAEVRCLPMADGGEGTARALVDATGGSMRAVPVHDPLGRPVEGHFGLLADGTTAVVETAEASGLALLEAKERNPLIASSYGTGELMLAAVRSGAKRIIVGLGGSATNDAGAGLLQALGVRLLDKNGNDLAHGGAALANLTTIDISTMDPALKNVAITAACDVTNPLTGPTGASAVFGPQKGASKDDVATLDAALAHFAQVIDSQLGVAVNDVPGAGAAGGIGAALKGFLNAEFRPGIAIVIEQSGLDAAAQWADVVFTGEGSIDFQTKFGKTPAGVAETAKRHGKPVIAVAGHIGTGIDELHEVGIDAVFGIAPGAASLSELLADAAANVTRTTEQIVRTLQL
ncbi:glycerate kinase [Bifidobacterium longum]|uniref:Glycerate kinase n=3 Tax=Bifidobacterium longum TaxID=216816 RepID=Q8G606_BIFLO|nr:glycerate kinase [Bifidobacterium longum NCC2705]KAB7221423.1 glycerate kinase [Bifidobacterium longum]MBD3900532.1 glycerate kinase [Bifidobacterium longum subsp. longum]KAB7223285.1 glycerate kinase [Bifidobacterium longum]KAB7227213.1 glycerate kinase [Bifidobacterium longum]